MTGKKEINLEDVINQEALHLSRKEKYVDKAAAISYSVVVGSMIDAVVLVCNDKNN